MAAELLRTTIAATAQLLERSRWLRTRFHQAGRLRILCYHGVCADAEVDQPWVPRYFVSASRFAAHMAMLKRHGPVVFLPDYLANADSVDAACTAVTFDDVPACTFRHALPVLNSLGIRASLFIATGHARTGRLFPADVLRLIERYPHLTSPGVRSSLASLLNEPARHKRMPLLVQRTLMAEAEAMVRHTADPSIVEALRCMNWDEVRTASAQGHEIGGHTVDHAILGWQDDDVRRAQIVRCAQDITSELGRAPVGFAYPNGGPGDFGASDERVLAECGFKYAVSTHPGANGPTSPRFALSRDGVSMAHQAGMLALELTGILDARRCTQAGWSEEPVAPASSAGVTGETPPETTPPQRAPASMRSEEYAVLDQLLHDCQPEATLEIGMATGGSSERICAYLQAHGGGHHVAIDPFQFAADGWAGQGVARVSRAGLGKYLEVIAQPDYLALPDLVRAGRRFDFILVDGWHSFDYTFIDLFYADLLLRVNGLLVIHDSNWPAVHRACRFLETHKAYARIGPPLAVNLSTLAARCTRRLKQLLGGPRVWRSARQRRTQWYALAAYRKYADGQVPNDHYRPF